MWREQIGKPLPFRNGRWRLYPICKCKGLTSSTPAAPAKATPAAAACAGLTRLEAVLAVHGTVASGLEWNCGLLSASGTDHRCAPRFTALVATAATARLLVLLCLAARFAALRRRI